MAILGDRVPVGLKIFLTALAIVDDIAAVLVIAVFYTTDISREALGAAGVILAVLIAMGQMGARKPLTFALGGIALWLAVLASGIHATIAGVALAMAVPSRTRLDPRPFLEGSRRTLDVFEEASGEKGTILNSEEQQAAVHALEQACEDVQPPLHRMEHELHPWVTFAIMPIFALANAGVSLTGNIAEALTHPITLGVILGLVIGKPLGIMLASWLAVRAGIASLPAGVTWAHVHGAGWLGGIGFTMSLFIASLAFADEALLTAAKLGILAASVCAATVGSLLLLKRRR
jgi:NhaA family Na+:H+ antiporter